MALFPTTDTIPSRALRDIRTGLNTMTIVFTYVTLQVVHMRRAKPVGLLVDERVLSAIKGLSVRSNCNTISTSTTSFSWEADDDCNACADACKAFAWSLTACSNGVVCSFTVFRRLVVSIVTNSSAISSVVRMKQESGRKDQ